MKIIIIKKNVKAGEHFNSYRSGFLSSLGIYCSLNRMVWWGYSTKEACIEAAKESLIPEPKPNKRVVYEVEI